MAAAAAAAAARRRGQPLTLAGQRCTLAWSQPTRGVPAAAAAALHHLPHRLLGAAGAADWWALGVLLYHVLLGSTPFAAPGDDELKIYKRIVRGMPAGGGSLSSQLASLPPAAGDLIQGLLVREPEQRLGEAPGGVKRLQAHAFFRGLNWDDLREGRVQLPTTVRESLFTAAAAGGTTRAPGGGSGLAAWSPAGLGVEEGSPPWLADF
jgi:hypothetical protein